MDEAERLKELKKKEEREAKRPFVQVGLFLLVVVSILSIPFFEYFQLWYIAEMAAAFGIYVCGGVVILLFVWQVWKWAGDRADSYVEHGNPFHSDPLDDDTFYDYY